jgi:flagellar biogenesis protein FliO
MVMDFEPSAVAWQLVRPANPRPVKPIPTSEVLIAVAVIAAIALLLGTGFMLGRMQQRRNGRRLTKSKQVKKRIDSRDVQGQRRNLRLVSPKKR